ncbi:MAG TPA: hypothetical protein VFW06_01400 [Acidimicrobiia bacterium]|nr:hypothetical protein [Acidimicrobiia bacterium]
MGPIEEHATRSPGTRTRARACRGRRRGRSGVLAIGLLAGLALTGCLPVAPPPPPPRIAVYGDSLVYESEAHLRAALASVLPGWDIIIRSYGGVAQCDYHASMVDDLDHRNVRAVIVAFVGNRLTDCVLSRPYPDSYYSDAHWAADLYASRGIPLAFVATPGLVGNTPADRIVPNVYRYVGSERGIRVVESDDLFVDPATGKYEITGPCLVGEWECADQIVIRAPDGGHLCPVPGSVPCGVYSSGVVRYDDGIVRMAALLAGFTPPAGRVLVTPTTTTTSTSTTTTSTSTTTTTTVAPLASGSATGAAPAPGSVLAPGVVYPTARPIGPYSPLGDLAPGR